MKKFIELENYFIDKYKIDLCDGTKCKDGDWGRTHAHPKQRRVCKWKQTNSVESLFELLHEIGHIEASTSNMRRAEDEFCATLFAIGQLNAHNITIPDKIIDEYQKYIDMTKARGIRRGGKDYDRLILPRD